MDCTLEIDLVDNGYVVRQKFGWTIPATLVFKSFAELVAWLKENFVEEA